MILFCIPGASASAMMFIKWRKKFNEKTEICPVELPGRGLRFREPLVSDMHVLANDLYMQIERRINEPYAILGYCLGSVVAYELYCEISRRGMPLPKHFFLASGASPDSQASGATLFHNDKSKKYLLEIMNYLAKTNANAESAQAEEFAELVSDYSFERKGIVTDMDTSAYMDMIQKCGLKMRNPESFAQEITNVIQIFNSDSIMLHSYKPKKPFQKIKVPTTMIWAGDDHLLDSAEPEKWQKFIDAPFETVSVSGEHLFLFSSPSESIEIIKRRMEHINV